MRYMKNGKVIEIADDITDSTGIFEEIEMLADIDLDDDEILSKIMQADKYTDAIIERMSDD